MMALNQVTLSEAKRYLHYDEDDTDEDTDIENLISAAELYLTNAGCILNPNNEVAKLAIKMLIVHWHENRNSVIIGMVSKNLEFSLQSIMTQLKYCYEVTT